MLFAVKNCGTISQLENGIVTGNIYTVNGTLLLECLPHTHIEPEVYNMTTTCSKDGMWVPTPPTKCESKLSSFKLKYIPVEVFHNPFAIKLFTLMLILM